MICNNIDSKFHAISNLLNIINKIKNYINFKRWQLINFAFANLLCILYIYC